MSGGVFTFFCKPPSPPHYPSAVKEVMFPESSGFRRVPNQMFPRIAGKLLKLNNFLKAKSPFGWERLLMPNIHFCASISGGLALISSAQSIMSGYWIGPEVEDGWGYIDAAVDRVSVDN